MRQSYHAILKPDSTGGFVGWVEEVPGAISHGRSHSHSLDDCRRNLRQSLLLLIETHRDEARSWLDASCIEEPLEIDTEEFHTYAAPHHEFAVQVSMTH